MDFGVSSKILPLGFRVWGWKLSFRFFGSCFFWGGGVPVWGLGGSGSGFSSSRNAIAEEPTQELRASRILGFQGFGVSGLLGFQGFRVSRFRVLRFGGGGLWFTGFRGMRWSKIVFFSVGCKENEAFVSSFGLEDTKQKPHALHNRTTVKSNPEPSKKSPERRRAVLDYAFCNGTPVEKSPQI